MIKEIEIKKFRNIENQKCELGKIITLIAGQNGVGKSSLLGLIGQPFSFYNGKKWKASAEEAQKEKYNSEKYRDLYNESFETEFKQIFRLSSIYDHPDFNLGNKNIEDENSPLANQYYYSLKFYENKFKLAAVSCYTKDRGKEIGKESRTLRIINSNYMKNNFLNYSNFILPVKYLGLNRVLPIVDLSKEQINPINFTQEEQQFFQIQKNYILLLNENYQEKILKEGKITKTVVNTDYYDYEGMSIGQDNISKIISTIISFRRLKRQMKKDYKGGILLIDELETTLFPAAQYNLLNFLYRECKNLKIQLIATTHSIELIKQISLNKEKFEFGNKLNILYLTKKDNKVSINCNYDYNKISFDLTLLSEKEKQEEKIKLYFEDKEARIIFKKLLGTNIFNFFDCPDVTLGCNEYIALYQHNFIEFKKGIIVLDGDANDENKYTHTEGIPINFCFLPGETPEKLIYNCLDNLSESHEFWTENKYTKQKFRNNFYEQVLLKIQKTESKDKERVIWKEWFNSEKKYWGREASKVINVLKKENPRLKKELLDSVKKSVEYIIEKYQKSIKFDF